MDATTVVAGKLQTLPRRRAWPRLLLLGLIASIALTTYGSARIRSYSAVATVSLSIPAASTPNGSPAVPIPVPKTGSFVLEDDQFGRLAARDPDHVRPIGSIAKAMTALAVLAAHPLRGSEQGPKLTMTDHDVADFKWTLSQNGSWFPVKAGDTLTERDMLYALMLPSANNIAETLGRWVGVSRTAFVDELNSRAREMGLLHTHFDDASGFSPKTVSTASDLVLLARAVLNQPVLTQIVATREQKLTDGLTVYNLDWLLTTQPGWLGIKTGETDEAGACFMFAVRRIPVPGEKAVTLVGAVLGEPLGLGDAFNAAIKGADAAFRGYERVSIAPPQVVGSVITAGTAPVSVSFADDSPTSMLLRKGSTVTFKTTTQQLSVPVAAGQQVARVTAFVNGAQVASWDVVADQPLDEPSWSYRLTHR